MEKDERLHAALKREPVDRIPVALWQHFPGDDQRAESLARAALDFQQRFDFDFIKLTPSNAHAATDWGSTSVYHGNPDGLREFTDYAIRDVHDWERLKPLDVSAGMLGQQLECVRLVRRAVGSRVPISLSVFNPLFIAKTLAGPGFIADLRERPALVGRGLEVIGETMVAFSRQALANGADGIFLATQHATYDLLSRAEYEQFGRPYDLAILEAARAGWLNLLHIHAHSHLMFDLLAQYPVAGINWHDRETWPSLSEGQRLFPGGVVGGLARFEDLVLGTPATLQEHVAAAVAQTGGRGLVIATDCVLPLTAPQGNVHAVVAAAVELGDGGQRSARSEPPR
ncbi:MAG: hypothetical protein M5U01_14430 [Ardenticatenaceae bacterium]|nr:hypothetical protein [Ardenticatenaceae bacterium]